MKINHISLSDFRIFKRLEISFPSHLNILAGNNAQGKTSILEAIHFISLLTSSVARHDRELIHFATLENDIPVSRIVADVEKKNGSHRIEIRLIFSKNGPGGRLRKEVLIDGAKKKLLSSVGYFNSVIFLPQMTRIIEDGPDERRKYLDRTLSQAFSGYVRALSGYNQAITRRNALLKQLAEQGGSRDQLEYWDDLITEHGAVLISLRAKAVGEIQSVLRDRHGSLTDGTEQLNLKYMPSLGIKTGKPSQSNLLLVESPFVDDSIDEVKKYFKQELTIRREEEIRRGVTTIGPHRDDLRFIANELDLGVFGSRGQIRTAVMALKLAEVYWLKERTGETPVLLLDETMAELDKHRRKYLLAELIENSQSILTTTDLELFPESFIKQCVVSRLQDGSVLDL